MINLFINKRKQNARTVFTVTSYASSGESWKNFLKNMSVCFLHFLLILVVYGNASVHKSGTKLVFMDDSLLLLPLLFFPIVQMDFCCFVCCLFFYKYGKIIVLHPICKIFFSVSLSRNVSGQIITFFSDVSVFVTLLENMHASIRTTSTAAVSYSLATICNSLVFSYTKKIYLKL